MNMDWKEYKRKHRDEIIDAINKSNIQDKQFSIDVMLDDSTLEDIIEEYKKGYPNPEVDAILKERGKMLEMCLQSGKFPYQS